MGDFDKYLDEAKDLAKEAGEAAKTVAGEVVDKAKKLTEEGSAAREIARNAKEQATAISGGIRERVRSAMQDAGAGKEIKQGVSELEALPEFEGSILYSMEIEALISDLKRLDLIINDDRMDKDSVAAEIKKVIEKVQPSDEPQTDDLEQQWIARAKDIAFNACLRALDALA